MVKHIKINKSEEERLNFILSQFVITHSDRFHIYGEEIKLCNRILGELRL